MGSRSRILIVRDEESTLESVRGFFAIQGYEVDCAWNVAQAESLVEKHNYLVVILDRNFRWTDDAGKHQIIKYLRGRRPPMTFMILDLGSMLKLSGSSVSGLAGGTST